MDPQIRIATAVDLPAIIALLADDVLGETREDMRDPLPGSYVRAFAAIEADPNNQVIVLEDAEGIAGTLQITVIPNLTLKGLTRCQIEGVRVAGRVQGQGWGRKLFEWAAKYAREKGCGMIQVTTNRARPDAYAFYEALGFEASHVGLKLYLNR